MLMVVKTLSALYDVVYSQLTNWWYVQILYFKCFSSKIFMPHVRCFFPKAKGTIQVLYKLFITFPVSKSQCFFPIWILIFLIYYTWETSRNKLKKHSVTKNCSDLSLFKQIVLMISKFLQIFGLQPLISKILDH